MVKVSAFKWEDSENWGVKIEMVHEGSDYGMNLLLDVKESHARNQAEQLQLRFDLIETIGKISAAHEGLKATKRAGEIFGVKDA